MAMVKIDYNLIMKSNFVAVPHRSPSAKVSCIFHTVDHTILVSQVRIRTGRRRQSSARRAQRRAVPSAPCPGNHALGYGHRKDSGVPALLRGDTEGHLGGH
jgi:hypothetical protein